MNDPRWLSDVADGGRRALREALDEAPPFGPSDVRRRRVWSALMRPGARRWAPSRAFAAGAVLASVVTAIGFLSIERIARWTRAPRPATRVVSLAGASRSPSPLPTSSPPVVGTAPEEIALLTAGAGLKTGPHQRAARRFATGARAQIEPSSWLVLDAAARPEVRGGAVVFDVPPQPPDRLFVVWVSSYRVTVAGARFSVTLAPGAARVQVQAGTAMIWGRGRLARVTAGETWTHALPTPPSRSSAVAPLGQPAEEPPAAPAAASDVADLGAARQVRGQDPARAIALYERIFERGGAAAENALYEIGSIYHDQVRDPERALAAWERCRTHYPHGQLRAETDLSIVDALAGLGQSSRALEEALAFLRRHPQSERRGEVARVAGDLARGRGQCRLAASLYAEVAGAHASPDDLDDAAFGRALCQAVLGDPGATEALDAYLSTHPRGRHVAEAHHLIEARR
jgi:hypothetical protein